MLKKLFMAGVLMAASATATAEGCGWLEGIVSCGNRALTECGASAADRDQVIGKVRGTQCMANWGFYPKMKPAQGYSYLCGWRTNESLSTVLGECSGAEG